MEKLFILILSALPLLAAGNTSYKYSQDDKMREEIAHKVYLSTVDAYEAGYITGQKEDGSCIYTEETVADIHNIPFNCHGLKATVVVKNYHKVAIKTDLKEQECSLTGGQLPRSKAQQVQMTCKLQGSLVHTTFLIKPQA